MRKYISTFKYGNILPLNMEIYYLTSGGNLFPAKYINLNLCKETLNCFFRAFETARIVNNLTIVANTRNLSLQDRLAVKTSMSQNITP